MECCRGKWDIVSRKALMSQHSEFGLKPFLVEKGRGAGNRDSFGLQAPFHSLSPERICHGMLIHGQQLASWEQNAQGSSLGTFGKCQHKQGSLLQNFARLLQVACTRVATYHMTCSVWHFRKLLGNPLLEGD